VIDFTLGGGYTGNDSKVGFWLRWLCSKFFVFTRALPFGNGHSLQTKNLRSRLAKIPTFKSLPVYRKNGCEIFEE
jgi:hypothetical protein